MNQSQNLPQDMSRFPEQQMMCKETLCYVSDESACLLCLTKQYKKSTCWSEVHLYTGSNNMCFDWAALTILCSLQKSAKGPSSKSLIAKCILKESHGKVSIQWSGKSSLMAGQHSLVRLNGLLWQIKQTLKVHDINMFFILYQFFSFTLVCEGHFILCYHDHGIQCRSAWFSLLSVTGDAGYLSEGLLY